jgi:hypothetical protein
MEGRPDSDDINTWNPIAFPLKIIKCAGTFNLSPNCAHLRSLVDIQITVTEFISRRSIQQPGFNDTDLLAGQGHLMKLGNQLEIYLAPPMSRPSQQQLGFLFKLLATNRPSFPYKG